MGTLIPQTKYDVLPPGTVRVRLGAVAVEDGIYGKQVVMRFDVLDEEFAGRCIKAWAAAKLSGGRRPSKLYSWTSAQLFPLRAAAAPAVGPAPVSAAAASPEREGFLDLSPNPAEFHTSFDEEPPW